VPLFIFFTWAVTIFLSSIFERKFRAPSSSTSRVFLCSFSSNSSILALAVLQFRKRGVSLLFDVFQSGHLGLHQLHEVLVQCHVLVDLALQLVDAAPFRCPIGFKLRIELGAEDLLDLRDAILGILDWSDKDGVEIADVVCGADVSERKP